MTWPTDHVAVMVPDPATALVVSTGCTCGWDAGDPAPVDPAVAVLAWTEHLRAATMR